MSTGFEDIGEGEEITEEAKAAAAIPPEKVEDAADLPDDVRDGIVDDDAVDDEP